MRCLRPGTGRCRCPGRLTYFISGQGWTGHGRHKAWLGAKCKHKDEISFLPPLPSLFLVSLRGGHESVTALKMTDTACWSHGQEREASHTKQTNKHTHTLQTYTQLTHTTDTHTHTHGQCEMKFQRCCPPGRTFCIWLSCFKLYCLRL